MKFSITITLLALAITIRANALIDRNPSTQRFVLRDPQAPTIEQVCADHPGSPCNTDEDCYNMPACKMFGFPACQCICKLCDVMDGQTTDCCKFCSGWGPDGGPDGEAPWSVQQDACASNIGSKLFMI